MAKVLTALESPSHLKDGEPYQDFLAELGDVQHFIAAYGCKHGTRAKGKKATVTLTVDFTIGEQAALSLHEEQTGVIDISASVKTKLPDAPPYVSVGMVDLDPETGKFKIMVNRNESNRPDPRQDVLADVDGKEWTANVTTDGAKT